MFMWHEESSDISRLTLQKLTKEKSCQNKVVAEYLKYLKETCKLKDDDLFN